MNYCVAYKYGDPGAERKRHLVVVITADVKHKKLLCVEVHIEGKDHSEASIAEQHLSLITEEGININRFYGDGAFDSSSMFKKLHSLKIKPVIKIRKNASADWYNGSKYRRREVREYKDLGVQEMGRNEFLWDEVGLYRGYLFRSQTQIRREHSL